MTPKMVDPNEPVNSGIKSEEPKNQKPIDEGPIYMEIKGLPSKMKLYPKGTKIEGRPLKVLEVKRLAGITEENSDAIINDILRRTIKGIEIDNLLVSDKMYIIFWLRANTYRESGFGVPFTCGECGQDSNYEFTLDNLQIQSLPDDFSINKTFINLKNGDKISFHLPTIADERKSNRFKIAYANVIKELDDELVNFAIMIDSINEKELDIINKYNYLVDIDPQIFSYLVTELEKFDCGIKSYLEVKCDKCGGVGPVGITFREDFFLPKYTS